MLKKSLMIIFALVLSFSVFHFDLQTASALPPGTPSKSEAQSQLNSLTVKNEDPMTGYSRDHFPHWISQGSGCDTRQIVLQRDADYYSGNCPVTTGKWYSYFDGVIVYSPSEIDIPLCKLCLTAALTRSAYSFVIQLLLPVTSLNHRKESFLWERNHPFLPQAMES